MIDVNVTLSRWPFRRLAGDEPGELAARLRSRDVVRAWAGTFDGIFHKDLTGANMRLAADCRRYGEGLLIPFGSVNPKLPDWQEDLRRCHEGHGMPGIRLYPNYHGYRLDDAAFLELLRLAAARGLVVQLAASMEDERTQHPLFRVPSVDLAPLPDVMQKLPRARIVILNDDHLRQPDLLRKLSGAPNVYFEISMVETVGGVARLAQEVSANRVLFGSNYPLYYFEAALLKIRESGFAESQKAAVLEKNARSLYAG